MPLSRPSPQLHAAVRGQTDSVLVEAASGWNSQRSLPPQSVHTAWASPRALHAQVCGEGNEPRWSGRGAGQAPGLSIHRGQVICNCRYTRACPRGAWACPALQRPGLWLCPVCAPRRRASRGRGRCWRDWPARWVRPPWGLPCCGFRLGCVWRRPPHPHRPRGTRLVSRCILVRVSQGALVAPPRRGLCLGGLERIGGSVSKPHSHQRPSHAPIARVFHFRGWAKVTWQAFRRRSQRVSHGALTARNRKLSETRHRKPPHPRGSGHRLRHEHPPRGPTETLTVPSLGRRHLLTGI